MKFALTEEQNLIRDSAISFLQDISTSSSVRAAMDSELGYDPDLWRTLCQEMFWQAMHIPEAYGGLGLSYVELVSILEQMGQTLLCSPFFSTVCLGANALLITGDENQKTEYLGQICSGKTATFAHVGPRASHNGGQWHVDAIDAQVTPTDGGYLVTGEWAYVVDGQSADIIILAARDIHDEVCFFVISGETSGLKKTSCPTMDQTRRLARLSVEELFIPADQKLANTGINKLNQIIDLELVALSAEQLGGAQKTLDMSVAYTKERKQFNRPIASFQAIKHQAADMLTRAEAARSGVYYAACITSEFMDGRRDEMELMEAAAISKTTCSDAYFANAANALQMHGGVGFTWEFDVHLHLKRAKNSEHFLGTGNYHRERLAAFLLDGLPDARPNTKVAS